MKECVGCHQTKTVVEFSKNVRRPDGYSAYCKPCRRAQSQDYYKRKAKSILKKNNHRKNEQRLWLWKLKSGPCVDCKQVFHPYVMDFDHRDGSTKVGNISAMARTYKSDLLAELAKCDLVCSNCHRMRTLQRAKGMPAWPV